MVWARLDDEILDNEKIANAGVLGFAMHVAAITWCCRKTTDGFVPYSRVRLLLDLSDLGLELVEATGSPEGWKDKALGAFADLGSVQADKVAEKLVVVGLWRKDEERGGYWVHDFLEYNPSKAEADAAREATREAKSRAGKMGAEARWHRGTMAQSMAPAMAPAMAGRMADAMAPAMAEARQGDVTSMAPIPIPIPEDQDPPSRAGEGTVVVVDDAEPLADDARRVWDANTMTRRPTDEVEIVWSRFMARLTDQTFVSRKALLGRWKIWILDQCKFDEKKRAQDSERPKSFVRGRTADLRQPHDMSFVRIPTGSDGEFT